MKKKHIFYLISIIIALWSCERVLDVDFSNEKPLIVMNGVVEPDKPIIVSISKSFPYLNTDALAAYLKDASVELHINDKFVEKLQLISIDSTSSHSQTRRGIILFTSKALAGIGDRVRIEASAPDMETAWAETVIPTPPTIGKVDTASFLTMAEMYDPYGNYGYGRYDQIPEISHEPFFRMLRLHIDVQRADNNYSQYFLINLLAVVDSEKTMYNISRRGLHIDTQEDPIFANDPKNSLFDSLFEKNNRFSGSVFFSDNAFKNNGYTLNVSTYGYYDTTIQYEINEDGAPTNYKSHTVENLPIEIQISSLAPDWYAYLKSKEERGYDDEGLSFISEPIVTPTNVHNGIGFLGSMSHTTKIIETPVFNGKENEVPR